MEKDNSIINSLKRLERVGSESSRSTEKLKKSCVEVAKAIRKNAEIVYDTSGTTFSTTFSDCNYSWFYLTCRKNKGDNLILIETEEENYLSYEDDFQKSDYFEGPGNRKEFEIDCIDNITRERALRFAADISNGLLDEVADEMEEFSNKSKESLEQLQEKLKSL